MALVLATTFKAVAPTGFAYWLLLVLCSKVKTSIEGQNLQQQLYGNAGAVYLTVSFWAKATVTGT